jgi:hypothetical protein
VRGLAATSLQGYVVVVVVLNDEKRGLETRETVEREVIREADNRTDVTVIKKRLIWKNNSPGGRVLSLL